MSKIYEALLQAELERLSGDSERRLDRAAAIAVAEQVRQEPVAVEESKPAPVQSVAAPYFSNRSREVVWEPVLHMLPALQSRGAAVEQFRSLRSHIFELRSRATLKTILVSSGMPQEGKSFVASNLALGLSLHRQSKVLLIDGDMRRSSLHKVLGTEVRPGLAEYLAGKASLEEIVQRAAQTEGSGGKPFQNLSFIAGGEAGDKSSDLSANKRFDELIAAAAPHFEWIIVDSSPVTLVSDAVNMARAVDGVLLVARSAVTRQETAKRTVAEFKSAKVLGFVLNGSHEAPTGGYYGYDSAEQSEATP